LLALSLPAVILKRPFFEKYTGLLLSACRCQGRMLKISMRPYGRALRRRIKGRPFGRLPMSMLIFSFGVFLRKTPA